MQTEFERYLESGAKGERVNVVYVRIKIQLLRKQKGYENTLRIIF